MTIIIRMVVVEIVVIVVGGYKIIVMVMPRIAAVVSVIIGVVIGPSPAECETIIVPSITSVVRAIINGRPTPIITEIDTYAPGRGTAVIPI